MRKTTAALVLSAAIAAVGPAAGGCGATRSDTAASSSSSAQITASGSFSSTTSRSDVLASSEGTGSSGFSVGSTTASTSSSSGSGPDAGHDAGVPTGTIDFGQCTPSPLSDTMGCGASGSFSFDAEFKFDLPSDYGCTVVTSGSCMVSTCTPMMAFPSGDDAGILSISGGAIPAGAAIMNFGDGAYSYSAGGTIFTPGQLLTASTTGATVPAFSHSVTAPALVTLTAPTLAADGGATTIPISIDLAVSWTGGEAGGTMTLQGGGDGGGTYSSVSCAWDATVGHGTVPHALLGKLAGQTDSFLQYGQETKTTFMAGAYSITESATLYSQASVTFQ